MAASLSEGQRAALAAFTDTIVPRIERDDDDTGFWARTATDLGVNLGVEQLIDGIPDPALKGGLIELLDGLDQQGIARAPSQFSREQLVRNMTLFSPDAAAGISALIGMTLFLFYGAPDPATGQNPNWRTFGYRGPLSAPPADPPRDIEPTEPADGAVIDADVCVVGSGAGGGVVAGTLAQSGMKVVVLDQGDYRTEADFAQLELKAYQELYWRGGPTATADGNVTLMAGSTVGGGTVVNWTNCLRTHPWVREQWAREHGLEGLDGPEYDRHLDTVLARISANDDCSHLNGPQQRLKEGCERLGLEFKTIVRNTDPSTYDPASAAYIGFGDQTGSKRSTVKTFLRDAHSAGATIIARCRAQRVLTESGRAAGVEAVYTDAAGTPRAVTVRAPKVVVACGALESPALLLRSGIGGPAVGRFFRLHPTTALFGTYAEDQEAWWGAPQAGLSEHYANTGDGYGFMIETAQYAPAITGSSVAWRSGAEHKDMMSRVRYGASFIALTRDRGSGQIVTDANGEAVPLYEVTDEVDLANLRAGLEAMTRIHVAAGAREIYALAAGFPHWRVGDDVDAFIERIQRIPMRLGGHKLFSAHQMGTCRMGTDPEQSVAGPWGELHDTRGVYIGDASAFPTSSGTNPMVTIMALAHRTASAIAGASGAERGGATVAQPVAK